MLSSIFVLLFLFACASLIFFGIKRNKQKALISLGIGVISFILVGIFAPETPVLNLDSTTIETDKDGLGTLSGRTNKDAFLKIDGQEIALDDTGKFSHDIQLTDENTQTVKVTSRINSEELTETVKVNASSSFKKKLAMVAKKEEEARLAKIEAEKSARELAELETAVRLAETELTEKNYDNAFTLLLASKQQPKALAQRLEKVKDELNLQSQLAAKKASAEEALNLAENEPNESNYSNAKTAINAMPEAQQTGFIARLATVKESIDAQQQTPSSEDVQITETEAPVSEMVLVTPTGKKYHNHVCGNGTYSEDSLENAKARGLTACSKCF